MASSTPSSGIKIKKSRKVAFEKSSATPKLKKSVKGPSRKKKVSSSKKETLGLSLAARSFQEQAVIESQSLPLVAPSLPAPVYPPPSFYQRERERKMTYYAMGVLSFFLGLLFVIYASVQNQFSKEEQNLVAQATLSSPLGGEGFNRLPAAIEVEEESFSTRSASEDNEVTAVSQELPPLWKKAKDQSSPQAQGWYWIQLLKNAKNLKNVEGLLPLSIEEGSELPLSNTWNAFTFSEILILLTRASSPEDFIKQWRTWRAMVQGTFHEKWLPQSEHLGMIKEMTSDWAKQSNVVVRESLGVTYLPLEEMKEEGIFSLPSGTLLSLVHAQEASHAEVVISQGLIIENEQRELFFVTALKEGTVRIKSLKNYWTELKAQYEQEKVKAQPWPLVGLHLSQVIF